MSTESENLDVYLSIVRSLTSYIGIKTISDSFLIKSTWDRYMRLRGIHSLSANFCSHQCVISDLFQYSICSKQTRIVYQKKVVYGMGLWQWVVIIALTLSSLCPTFSELKWITVIDSTKFSPQLSRDPFMQLLEYQKSTEYDFECSIIHLLINLKYFLRPWDIEGCKNIGFRRWTFFCLWMIYW